MNRQSISLIRHGPPAVSLRQRVSGHQFRQFLERYDAAKIERQAAPPRAVQRVMAQADFVFSSNRLRAMHTAELLGVPVPPVIDPRFREIEFPVDFPRHFRFSALTWTVLAVVLWRLGYSSYSEPFVRTKQRAQAAADLLEARADALMRMTPQEVAQFAVGDERLADGSVLTQRPATHSVVLVAHGGINRLIAKELRQRGWRGPRLPRSRHWGCTTYCR